jgi:hypothetical protein
MTRPRKADAAGEAPRQGDTQAETSDVGAPDDRATAERERAADLLVQLAGASVRGALDAEEARHDRMLAWMAAEARAALTPAERHELARDGDALVERVRARQEEERRRE